MDVIEACDKLVAAKDKQIKDSKAALDKAMEENKLIKDDLVQYQKREKSVIKQPAVWAGAGTIATVVAGPVGGVISILLGIVISN